MKEKLLKKLDNFIKRFLDINNKFKEEIYLEKETTQLLKEYTDFIIDVANKQIWEKEIDTNDLVIKEKIETIRKESAYTVCIMEKYRAKSFLESENSDTEYFKNIEGCIKKEFEQLNIDETSNILLIGVGSFPMTPIIIAKNTNAKIIGLDVDKEAVEFAEKIINLLGKNLSIEVSLEKYSDIPFTKKATHIIIASTIREKFEILEDLYHLTNENVIVMMRYGNGFKSLFNYPLEENLKNPWKKVDTIFYNDNVFDVAIYKK